MATQTHNIYNKQQQEERVKLARDPTAVVDHSAQQAAAATAAGIHSVFTTGDRMALIFHIAVHSPVIGDWSIVG